MANNSIFDFADKFGYVSPFGDWMQEEKDAREAREKQRMQERQNLNQARKPELATKFIFSQSVKIGFWAVIWKVATQVSLFKAIQDAMNLDRDYDIYIVRVPHIYSSGTVLESDGKYLTTIGNGNNAAVTLSVANELEFKNLKNGYDQHKKTNEGQRPDERERYEAKFFDLNEVADSFLNNKKIIIIKIRLLLNSQEQLTLLSKLDITAANYVISVAQAIIHELYAHAINLLNNKEKPQTEEHRLYHGLESNKSPELKTIEEYTGAKQQLPAYKVLTELKQITAKLITE
jgi:hypothetical protein